MTYILIPLVALLFALAVLHEVTTAITIGL